MYHTTHPEQSLPRHEFTVDGGCVPWSYSRQLWGIPIAGESVTSATQKDNRSDEIEQPSNSEHPELRDLVPFAVGTQLFAIFAEHIDGTAENKPVASLPHAPPAVLGIVCVRGRMLTVLDAVALCTGNPAPWRKQLPYVIALRGDEQLALAAEACRDAITVASTDIEAAVQDGAETREVILGVVRYAGEEITVLDVEKLFAAAMLRRERRRRRL